MLTRSLSRSKRIHHARRGMAVVEAAFAMPVLMIITFMTVDACNLIFLKQVANSIAFETARAAAKEGATFEEALEIGREFAQARGLSDCRIVVQPTDAGTRNREDMEFADTLFAEVTAPVSGNSAGGPFLLFLDTDVKSQRVVIAAQ